MNLTVALLRAVLNTTSLVAPGLAGKGAFALFRRILGRGRPRPEERSLATAAQLGKMTVGGKQVTTYRWGDGSRPVLLVHGWQSRATRLGAFVPVLREHGYSVIAFDAPGHGESEGNTTTILEFRDIIRELQDEYGTFHAVIAHSFGSLSSFFAIREGVKTRRMVAISGVSRFEHLVVGFCLRLGLNARIDARLRTLIETELFPGEPDIWHRFAAPHKPEDVPVPEILLIHDEDDDMAGVHQARETAEAYGDRARLVLTQGLGHRRILAGPEVVARVTDFVCQEADHHGSPTSA